MESSYLPKSNEGQINEAQTGKSWKFLRILLIVMIALEPIIILIMAVAVFNGIGSQFKTSDTTLLDKIDELLFALSCFSFPILGIIAVVLGSIGKLKKRWPDYKGIFAYSIASLVVFGSCYCLLLSGLLGS